MSCCAHIGCGIRSPVEDPSSLPARPRARRRSISPAPRYEPRRALSPGLILPPPSQNDAIIPQTAAQLSLFSDDSDDDGDRNGRDERGNSVKIYATNFGALRTRIIRRLSQKAYAKKDPYHRVGNSEEELARRAELKRARRKRIERELHQDGRKGKDKDKQPEEGAITPEEVTAGGPRDNLEFDIWLRADARAGDHGFDKFTGKSQAGVHNQADAVEKAHRRRSSCPDTPISMPCSPHHNVSLRGHISLPQIPPTIAKDSDSLFCSVMAADNIHCLLPNSVPVVVVIPHEESGEASDEKSQSCTTEMKETPEDRRPKVNHDGADHTHSCSQGVPIIVADHADATMRGENPTTLLDSETFHNFFNEDSPLDTWLRTQGIQALSLCSERTSDSAMSDHQATPQSLSSRKSVDSKLHALPLKQRSHNRVKLFPSPINGRPQAERPSHLVLSPDGLEHGALDICNHPVQPPGSSRCGSSNYATRSNSNDSILRPARAEQSKKYFNLIDTDEGGTDTGADQHWAAENDRANESRSSSYQTAFTTIDPTRAADRVPSQRWWEVTSGPASIEQDSASVERRESELLSVATRFGKTGGPSKIAAPTTSKFGEDLVVVKRGKENKSPVLAKIQFMLVLGSQKKKETLKDLRSDRLATERPQKSDQNRRPPAPGFALTCDPLPTMQEPSTLLGDPVNTIKSVAMMDSLNQCTEIDGLDVAPIGDMSDIPQAHDVGLTTKGANFLEESQKPTMRRTSTAKCDKLTQKTQSLYDDCAQQHAQEDSDSATSSRAETLKRSKSNIEHRASRRKARPDKFMTWHGAPARQRILFDSTLEFSAQLEQALVDARLMVLK
ncbi:hypothetical protein Micbo1qcDRAFT_170245 [Microdochium bolleyi]|uniref:Uncharacterized protein n=1 Tax=Microdochium bolleyi TaxID=196109 RepID=A0A136JGY6_9PEZI|nr:hypothetical protein Micbo1qcDRAFT_170245 [Microdochium bolleyi]